MPPPPVPQALQPVDHLDVRHTCIQCGRHFRRPYDLRRHIRSVHNPGAGFPCQQCNATFHREDNLRHHVLHVHTGLARGVYRCVYCDKAFNNQGTQYRHQMSYCPTLRNMITDSLPSVSVEGDDGRSRNGDSSGGGGGDLPHTHSSNSNLPHPNSDNDGEAQPRTSVTRPGGSSNDDNETRPGPSGEPHPRLDSSDDDEGSEMIGGSHERPTFELVERTFRGRLLTYRLTRPMQHLLTVEEALVFLFDEVLALLTNVMSARHSVKVNLFLECEFTNIHEATCVRAFKTKNVPLTDASDLEEFLSEAFAKLVNEKEQCELVGSGWTFLRIRDLEVRVNEYTPLDLAGRAHILLPRAITDTRAVVNTVNRDDMCFMYSILAKFVPAHPERPGSYTNDIIARYEWTGLRFPVQLKDIRNFERQNNISINVYGIERTRSGVRPNGTPKFQDTVFPLKICRRECEDHRDLLYVTMDGDSHYLYIRDLSRLVRPQLTAHEHRLHICKRCFAYFNDQSNKLGLTGEQRLEEHKRYCNVTAPLRLDISKKEKIKFAHPEYTRRERFCVYADFECALRPIADMPDERAPRGTTPVSVHVPYAFAYQIIDSLGLVQFEPRVHFGEDASKVFMDTLKVDVNNIWSELYNSRFLRPVLTLQEQCQWFRDSICYLCQKPFTEADPKVRDHNHAPPYEYRGAAHRSCNLRYREQRIVNVYFHNLSNYDAHFVVRELAVDPGDVDVLAHTEERYIAFTKRFQFDRPGQQQQGRKAEFKVRFLDSYRFLSSSLAGLAAALPTDRMKETKKRFPEDRLFDLVRRKGVFPYNFVTSYNVLYTTRELPSKNDFYNDLTLEHVTDEDYEHARNVWRAFECRNLRDYADTYLRCDIALLTDVFEQFRDTSLAEYGLDPAHYYTLPSYAWDVMLRTTGVELDTLRDFDMYLFVEQGIRGGISQAITRHAKANHDRCRPEDRRPDEPTRYLLYLDANNLYGWAMSQCLPTGDFQWLSREEIDVLDIASLDPEADRGYILEVNLHYPAHLHDLHKDLPYCCETKRPPTGKVRKLITTLDDKHHYICHSRILQQALQNGLELVTVHRAISFRQSRWLETYILMNTELRKKAKTKFEQDYFKLMNNAVFGKTIENVRKRLNVHLVVTAAKFRRLVAKSNFVDRTYYTDDVALVHLSKVKIVLDKPIYIGMCVLELSKWLMYDFLRRMKNRYGDRLEVAYMDTDSFLLSIISEDVYAEMKEHLDDFDTSAYPRSHPCYSPANAKVIGKFKDEANGRSLLEYLGLRSKLYYMDIADDDDAAEPDAGPAQMTKLTKRAKGVAKGVVKNILTADDYRKCLFDGVLKNTVNTRFQSHLHRVFTVQVEKLSLSRSDDKRYVLPDGIHTLPWGHKDIPQLPRNDDQDDTNEGEFDV